MISEKNQAVEDLQNVENAFADVHRKYERTKQVIQLLVFELVLRLRINLMLYCIVNLCFWHTTFID